MNSLRRLALFLALVHLAVVAPARADEKRASPHEKVSATIGGRTITIEYGRPYKKGRAIFGPADKKALVPDGEVWRTGADEATTLTTDGDIVIGDVKVPKGTYALFTVPGPRLWTLIVNKVAKQWGAYSYDKSQDLGRTSMAMGNLAKPVEQLTIVLEPQGKEGTLRISWDTTVAAVPVKP